MREEKKKRFRCIEAQTAAEFESEIQQIYDEHPDAEVIFHQTAPRLAYVKWTEKVRVIETLEDEFHERGVRLSCCDCPFYERPTDMRRRWTRCLKSNLPVHEDDAACEICYQLAAGRGLTDER